VAEKFKNTDFSVESSITEKTEEKLSEPKLYKVILLNDHYTTMDFVVMILRTIFDKSEEEAKRIMLQVHREGSGVCGVYTRDIALTKADEVRILARRYEYPLRCVCEPE